MKTNCSICILIIYFGKLPDWFDLWLYAAKKNSKVNFFLIQDSFPDQQQNNIQYINMTLGEFNSLSIMKSSQFHCASPYKLCDYRPLYADLFPKLISNYTYWGWSDLDVLYGDILGTLEESLGEYDYISTGWNGESGPLALLRNCEGVNSLWLSVSGVNEILNSQDSFAFDERLFVDTLRKKMKCDIKFRECLNDLPAVWRNGHLTALRTEKEYTLYHFGGHVSSSQKQIGNDSTSLIRHIRRGGEIKVKSNFKIVKIGKLGRYFLNQIYRIDRKFRLSTG